MPKVPKRIFRNWKLQKEHGDVKAIHEATYNSGAPISEVTISNAMRTGKCSVETMKSINDYYSAKRTRDKQKEADLLEELDGE